MASVPGATKKERRTTTAPTTPTKGAHKNSTWPTPPYGGGPALLLVQEPCGSGWSFGGKQNRRSHVVQIVTAAGQAANLCPTGPPSPSVCRLRLPKSTRSYGDRQHRTKH